MLFRGDLYLSKTWEGLCHFQLHGWSPSSLATRGLSGEVSSPGCCVAQAVLLAGQTSRRERLFLCGQEAGSEMQGGAGFCFRDLPPCLSWGTPERLVRMMSQEDAVCSVSLTGSTGINGCPDAGKEGAFPTLGGLGALLASLAQLS